MITDKAERKRIEAELQKLDGPGNPTVAVNWKDYTVLWFSKDDDAFHINSWYILNGVVEVGPMPEATFDKLAK